MCHSIGPPIDHAFDPNKKWRITSALLEMAISCARGIGLEAVTMDTAADRLSGTTSGRPFYALTFDDGYADNLYAALPVCEHNRVPMTTYVTSGFVQRTHVAWWHLIEYLIADNPTIRLTLEHRLATFDCGTLSEKQNTFNQLAQFLTRAAKQEQTDFIEEVRRRYGTTARTHAERLFLTESELQEFARNDYVHLGVHGASHCAFASLTLKELERELQESTDYLASLTHVVPRHLAYPYGSPETVIERDFEVVKSARFSTAVTTRHGCLSKNETKLCALPRIPLFPTDTEHSLRCKFSGLTTLFARWRAT